MWDAQKNTEQLCGRADHFVCPVGCCETMLEERTFTPLLYSIKGFFKARDLKEKQVLLLGWYYRPNELLMDQELDTA